MNLRLHKARGKR